MAMTLTRNNGRQHGEALDQVWPYRMFFAELSRASEVLTPISFSRKAASWCTMFTLMRSTATFRSSATSSLGPDLS